MTSRFLSAAALACTLTSARAAETILIDAGAPASALIPSAANGGNAPGYQWRLTVDPDNIASWLTGTTGAGYDANTGNGGNYLPQTGLNVGAMQSPAATANGSVFIRIPFTVDAGGLAAWRSLILRMRYDDGFVAYLNGTKIASAGEPANLAWNSNTLNGTTLDANLTGWEDFPIHQHLELLREGANMLAIQGLNGANNSSDLLILPQLAASDEAPLPEPRWPSPVSVELTSVGGLLRPVAIRNAGDGSGRLFIAEQRGIIHVLTGNTLTPFMDISARVIAHNDQGGGNEQGLLGLAFPPGFAQSRRFYVAYTRSDDSLQLSRFSLLAGNAAAGDPASEQMLLTIPHASNTNHNGSDIHFGADGLLYYSTGDGGGGGDTENNAQDPENLLGKMLCLDVEAQAAGGAIVPSTNPWAAAGDGVADQIYHLGLRNPWRWSFDRGTGDLWIGDVGQDVSYEEINMVPGNTPGHNFEWRRREGLHDFSLTQPYGPGTLTQPVTERTGGDRSVTGGYVYRGQRFPRMQGVYLYGDYASGRFYGVQKNSAGAWRTTTFTPTLPNVATFGEDEAGELYWGSVGNGRVYRIEDSGSDSAYLSIVSQSTDANGRVSFTWGVASGASYVTEVSTDMVTWTPVGNPQTGPVNFRLTFSETADPPAGTGRRYFRAREL